MIATKERRIDKEMRRKFLRLGYTERPAEIIDQGDEELGHKYKLLFYKSNVYDVVIVVSLQTDNSALNIVTAYARNRTKKKRLNVWLKRQ